MRLKYKFVIQKLGDKFAAVTADEDAGKFNGMLKVNELGMRILQLLQQETDKEAILGLLKDCFDNEEDLNCQVDEFLEKLKDADLLV